MMTLIAKCDSFFYYKVHWSVITKCDSFFITKCDKCCYKVRQVLQSVTFLIQSATVQTVEKLSNLLTFIKHNFSTDAAAQLLYKLEFPFFTEFTTRLAGL